MSPPNFKTPGVYINELNAFPNSVVQVLTAVPAFIGYTPQAEYEGRSYFNLAQKISSFADFKAIYCNPNPAPPADPAKQYSPQYYLVESESKPEKGAAVEISGKHYAIVPDPNTIYHLYNCIRMFYQNGGGDAYIVAVGPYGSPSGSPAQSGGPIVNPNVKLADLRSGLELLKNKVEPTMYLCPEATLLPVAENGTLMQEMLGQSEGMGTALSIFDIIGGKHPDPILFTSDIETFRSNTGSEGLRYGASYYPFIETTTMAREELNYTNLFGGDLKQLKPLLNPSAGKIIEMIENPPANPLTESQHDRALLNTSKTYGKIMELVLKDANILPPSGAIAGIYTRNDNDLGVWHAPANVGIEGVSDVTIRLTDSQQQNLNVDAASGKSVNAIRYFSGLGILIWGARTLDGNSADWRSIPVQRLITMIEQSCKLAIRAYVFEANDANTWLAVKSLIASFLTNIWKEGGLQGTSPDDAFQVNCGLGNTMTPDDLLNGIMNVTILVAAIHPAEFTVITISQEMETA